MGINDFLQPEMTKKDMVPWKGGEISAHVYHNAQWICSSNTVGSITLQKLRQVIHSYGAIVLFMTLSRFFCWNSPETTYTL